MGRWRDDEVGNKQKLKPEKEKSHRGNAAQYFTAGELSRRGIIAVITMGNCPNTDILCSNKEGNKFVHIQVKTFVPGNKTCSVGNKAEHDYGEKFIWVLAGIARPDQNMENEYYIIPSKDMSENVSKSFISWKETPGKNGRQHDPSNKVRTIHLPPFKDQFHEWDISKYRNRWDSIVAMLT